MNTIAISTILVLLSAVIASSSCVHKSKENSNALINSAAVDEYHDSIERVHLPTYLLKHEKRADEPYVLAGEDVLRLELITLSLIKSLGDKRFAEELMKLSDRQIAAVAVFVGEEDLGGKYPLTLEVLHKSRGRFDFPAVEISRREGVLP
jgi:hypothetical protein